jgi:hypothetical protein
MVAYTYTIAKDISANPGSSAASAWSSNSAVGSLNEPGLSWSNFATPHKFIGNVSYRLEYLGNLATTFSLVYQGYQTGRWSYTYLNDHNGDGNSSDLMYIPANENDILFVDKLDRGNLQMTADEQRTAFWNYVNANDYLKEHKGEYAERYGHLQPFVHRFDAKIIQDIFSNFGTDHKYTLQISFDLLNVGNWINDEWGANYYNPLASFENVRLLSVAARGTSTSAPTYNLNATSLEDFTQKTTVSKYVNTASTWGALFGIRLIF